MVYPLTYYDTDKGALFTALYFFLERPQIVPDAERASRLRLDLLQRDTLGQVRELELTRRLIDVERRELGDDLRHDASARERDRALVEDLRAAVLRGVLHYAYYPLAVDTIARDVSKKVTGLSDGRLAHRSMAPPMPA